MTRLLEMAHSARPVVLIDHYDRLSDVFDRVIGAHWIYSRLLEGLRDNVHVEKAIIMNRSGLAESCVQCSRVWASRARGR